MHVCMHVHVHLALKCYYSVPCEYDRSIRTTRVINISLEMIYNQYSYRDDQGTLMCQLDLTVNNIMAIANGSAALALNY